MTNATHDNTKKTVSNQKSGLKMTKKQNNINSKRHKMNQNDKQETRQHKMTNTLNTLALVGGH